MQPLKFLNASLVTYQDGIYEVLGQSSKGPEIHYKVILVASQREMTSNEFHTFVTKPNELIVEESLLNKFDEKVPKFKFGEAVRLRDMHCIVVWIQYKNHSYYYSVKEKLSHDGALASWGGWEKEESYLQKW